MVDKFGRDARLDLAKALAIFLVLFWHLKPLKLSETGGAKLLVFINLILKGFYFQITLVAVPLFIIVSLYLFYQKIENSSGAYAIKRLNRLGQVFLFWTSCQFAFYFGNILLKSIQGAKVDYSLALPVYKLIMLGGPPLPVVGGSVFYFNFVLFTLVLAAFLYSLLRGFPVVFLVVGTGIGIASLLYFEILNLRGSGLAYWRVDNFLVYIPVAYVLFKYESVLSRYGCLFWIGFIIFLYQDVALRNIGYNTGVYSRLSVVIGAVAIFISIMSMNNCNGNILTFFMSRHSLGIYALHKYMQFFVLVVLQYFGWGRVIYLFGFPLEFRTLLVSLLTFLMTAVAVLVLYHTPLKRFVS